MCFTAMFVISGTSCRNLRTIPPLLSAIAGLLRDKGLEGSPISPTTGQLLAISQRQDKFAAVAGLEFADLRNIDDHRAMHTRKPGGVQFLGHAPDRLPHQICLFAGVHANVVGGCFDPIDLLNVEKYDPSR